MRGEIVYQKACKLGCEGIESKRLGSPYRSGRSKTVGEGQESCGTGSAAGSRGGLGPLDTRRDANQVALGGRNLMTLISVIRTKMASTTAYVTAKGGSVCVGANLVRAETFTKLCTTKTKMLR